MAPSVRSRLLIVDDEEAILETMTFTFEDDYDVLTSTDARRALDLLDEHAPVAAVITDQRMPTMTGVEFLTRVYERHPATTRIILTGFADMDAIVKAINDGHVYAYITKPWEPDHLKQVVRRAVEHHVLTLENARLVADLRSSNVLLEAVMDQLGTGAVAIDPAGVVQAANQPARRFLGLGEDPRGRAFDDALGPELRGVAEAVLRLSAGEGGAESRFEELDLARRGCAHRLRVTVSTLSDPSGEPLGRVLLLREISHEPLRRRFEDVLGEIAGERGELRPCLERAVAELRKLAEEVRASRVGSPEMAELARAACAR